MGQIRHLDMLLSLERLRGIQWIPGDGQSPPEEWLPLLQRIHDAGKLCQLYVSPEGARTFARELGGRGFAFYILRPMSRSEAERFLRVIQREERCMELTGYLDFWFREVPIVERVERFAQLGIRRLDVWLWRERPLADLYAECQRYACILNSTFDPQPGNLVDAADHPRCLDAWAESLEMAERFEIPNLFVFSNEVEVRPSGEEWITPLSRDHTPGQMYANLLDGLARVLALAEKTNVSLWFEALNTFHIHGGVFIHSHEQAADIVRRLDHPQLKLAFDCYHQQRTAGNLIYGLEAYQGLYPTVHIGDVPTRQEPGTGEINFRNIAAKLRELSFDGLLGMEFYPSETEELALKRVKEIFEL